MTGTTDYANCGHVTPASGKVCGRKPLPGTTRCERHPLTPRLRCGAVTQRGRLCQAQVGATGTKCRHHGGAAPQVRRGKARRAVEVRARHALARAGEAAPLDDPVAALKQLAGEVVWIKGWLASRVTEVDDPGFEAFERALDRATKVVGDLARLGRPDVQVDVGIGIGMGDHDLDAQLERMLGNLISKPTQAKVNALYDALDAEADGRDVDEAVSKGLEARRRLPASLVRDSFTGSSLEDVPGVPVEVREHQEPAPESEPVPEELNVVHIGKIPPGFGTRRACG